MFPVLAFVVLALALAAEAITDWHVCVCPPPPPLSLLHSFIICVLRGPWGTPPSPPPSSLLLSFSLWRERNLHLDLRFCFPAGAGGMALCQQHELPWRWRAETAPVCWPLHHRERWVREEKNRKKKERGGRKPERAEEERRNIIIADEEDQISHPRPVDTW